MRAAPALLLGFVLLLGACRGGGGGGTSGGAGGASAAPRAGKPPISPIQGVPPGWGRMRPLLAKAEALAAAGDLPGLTALVPTLKQEGLGLLRSSVPNTLPRHETPRYLEARAAFGDALVRLAEAHEQGRAADLPELVRTLAGTWRGWMAVISGQAPERAV